MSYPQIEEQQENNNTKIELQKKYIFRSEKKIIIK